MKIERKYMAHYLNTVFAGDTGTAAYVRLGKDLEEYSPELSANVEKKSNIMGETSVTMNKITGFSVLTTGEGERVTLSYSVLDADGNIVSTNNRKNYVVLDEDVLTAIATIRTDAAAHLEG